MFEEHGIKLDYAMSSASLAHTYGNVTCFITEWIKTLFPKNYFKTVHVSSTIAYRNFTRFNNNKKEFIKKSKPMLIIKPRIEMDNDEGFLKDTYFTTRIVDAMDGGDYGNLQPFVEDPEFGRYIKFLMNRLNISFDVTIITETQMEQINLAHYIKNRIRQGRPFFLSTSLESFIPRDIVALVARDIQVPLKDADGSVKVFLDYLNSKSYYPITYKYKNSSGRDEFFRYHPADIDTTITNLSIDDGNKKGQIYDSFAINFTVNCEFSTAGLYYYFTKSPDLIQEYEKETDSTQEEISSSQMIPTFTISNLFDVEVPEGWNLYTSPMYTVEQDRKPFDLDFSILLNTSLVECVNYHNKHGIPIDTFIQVSVMKNNKMMDESIGEYKIDWEKLILTTYNCNVSSTYRFIMHVNTHYINELVKDLLDLDNPR